MSDATRTLPPGWRLSTLPSIVGDSGLFIDGDWVESKDQDPEGDVRLVQLADVGDGVFRDRSSRFMTRRKAADLRCTYLKAGDVLVARMPDPLGRACLFPGDRMPCVTVVDVCIIRPGDESFDPAWLMHFLNAHPTRAAIASLQAGSTRKRISRGNLGTIQLPVPPISDQRRIVAEIERQFTRLDAGVAGLDRVRANLKRYRAAVLKAACEGTLVPTEADLARAEGRDYETGDQLLERILTARRENWTGKGKYKTPALPDTAGLPPLPEGWTWATIKQVVALVTTGATPLRSNPAFWLNGTIPWVTSGALNHEFVNQADEWITDQAVEQTNTKVFPSGTLLVALYGEGKTRGKVSELGIAAATNQACAALLFDRYSDAFRAYLKHFLMRNYHDVRTLSSGGVQPNLSVSLIRGMRFPLPPLAEQHRIVAEVERRLSVVDELEALVETNLARAGRLRQSILAKAFSGELVQASGDGAVSPPPAPRKKKGPPNGGPEGRPTAGKGPVQSSASR